MMIADSLPGSSAARRTLSPNVAYALVAGVIGLALFASGTPSPLYGTYQALWGFSPLVLTLVYATYAFGVLSALILAGRVSDEVGRRPVLLASLGTLMGATVLFMVADSVAWLFVARAVQGLATGLALGAASAAMLDLHPHRDPAGVGLTNGVVSAAGIGLGVLTSSLLVELLPAPRVLPYVLLFVLFAIALAGAAWMPEPVAIRSRLRLTPQRPSVPPTVRRAFRLAVLGVTSSWAIAGIFLSLGPQLAGSLFHTTDHLVAGVSVFALAGSAAIAQMVFRRAAPLSAAAIGSVALAAGMVTVVAAAATASGALFLAGAVVGGGGFGVAFLGALRALSVAIPAQHRGAVMSAFYIVAYASLSLPAVFAGVLVTPLGLQSTFEILGSAIAALALVAAIEAWRMRSIAVWARDGVSPATIGSLSERRPRVVVVGGGFGGLQATLKLARQPVEVTLIDRRNFHLFQPLAYQVATGALSPAEIAYPLRRIFRRYRNVRIVLAEVYDIDLDARLLKLRPIAGESAPDSLGYDALIVSGGSQYNYFGHDAWREQAAELKTLEGALTIRRRLFEAFEAAELEPDAEQRAAWLTFVVVGAGPTGVEMAGQIAEIARDVHGDFRSFDSSEARILLVEAGERILNAFPPPLSVKAQHSLERLGVTPRLGHAVTDIDRLSVTLQRPNDAPERIPARTVIWAAGVVASSLADVLAQRAGLELDRAGRVEVLEDLSLPGHPEVLAIADMVRIHQADGASIALPGLAPVAMQQGRHAARVVRDRLRGRPTRRFRYRDKGKLATIGRGRAIAEIKGVRLSGFSAWVTWLTVHLRYLIGFENRLLVLIRWAFSYITHGRGARLITGEPERPSAADTEPMHLTPAGTRQADTRRREAA